MINLQLGDGYAVVCSIRKCIPGGRFTFASSRLFSSGQALQKSKNQEMFDRFSYARKHRDLEVQELRKDIRRAERDPVPTRQQRSLIRLQADMDYLCASIRYADAGIIYARADARGPEGVILSLIQVTEDLLRGTQALARMKLRSVPPTVFAPLEDVDIIKRLARIMTMLGVCIGAAIDICCFRRQIWACRLQMRRR